MSIISPKLGFYFSVVPVRGWGDADANGNWQGIVGAVRVIFKRIRTKHWLQQL